MTDPKRAMCIVLLMVSAAFIVAGVVCISTHETSSGSDVELILGIVLLTVGGLALVFTVVVYRKGPPCTTPFTKPSIKKDVSFVGFGRRTVINVRELANTLVDDLRIHEYYLARNEDFTPMSYDNKLVLVAAFTERNNIFGLAPDYGELSVVYQNLSTEMKARVLVIYAGVPKNQYPIAEDRLYPDQFTRMLRHQPAMGELMDQGHFIVVNSDYCMNSYQRNTFINWLVD